MKVIYFFLAGLLLAGCSKNSSSEKADSREAPSYEAFFYVRYLEAEQSLQAEAHFNMRIPEKDSVAERISLPGGVFVLDNEMKSLPMPGSKGTLYRLTLQRPCPLKVPLRAAPGQHAELKAAASMQPVLDFDLQFLSKDSAQLQWEGDPLEQEEQLVTLVSDAGNRSQPLILEGPTGSNTKKISTEPLRLLQPGPVSIYLVRIKHDQNELGNSLIHTSAEYYSRTKEGKLPER